MTPVFISVVRDVLNGVSVERKVGKKIGDTQRNDPELTNVALAIHANGVETTTLPSFHKFLDPFLLISVKRCPIQVISRLGL